MLHDRATCFWFRIGQLALAMTLLLGVAACDSKLPPESGGAISLPLGAVLGARSLPDGIALEGRIEIPQLQRNFPLTITDGAATTSLNRLIPGSYTVRLSFEAANTGFGRFMLVEAERRIEITKGLNRLSFAQMDYHYPDRDNDHYSNLDEVRQGTNPDDPVQFPDTAVMFVTSESGSGDLSSWPDAGGESGIPAGDVICQARAAAAGLEGEFVAWLSDASHDAYCRVHGLDGKKADNCGQQELPKSAGPWLRTDGKPFSAGIEALVERGVIYYPPVVDEFGRNSVEGEWIPGEIVLIWTGTSTQGEISNLQHNNESCRNWTNAESGRIGRAGLFLSSSATWTERLPAECNEQARLFCFEARGGIPLPRFEAQGKRVFLTSVSGTGDLASWPDAAGFSGIDAGDAICRSRAAAGGLPNSQRYKAWLSGSTVNAVERLFSDGPWVRLDGVVVAESKQDLVSFNGIKAAIAVDEYGNHFAEYTEITADDTWSATGNNGRSTENHCNDWTSGSEQDTGSWGTAAMAGSVWTASASYVVPCSTQLKLFCFED